MKIAMSEAALKEKEAEALKIATTAEKIQAARALEESYAAERAAEEARRAKEQATLEADIIVRAEAKKKEMELAASNQKVSMLEAEIQAAEGIFNGAGAVQGNEFVSHCPQRHTEPVQESEALQGRTEYRQETSIPETPCHRQYQMPPKEMRCLGTKPIFWGPSGFQPWRFRYGDCLPMPMVQPFDEAVIQRKFLQMCTPVPGFAKQPDLSR